MNEIIKILIVDEYPLFGYATKELLNHLDGVEVVDIANNAEQCMEKMSSYQPDLVFLDYTLPDQLVTEVTRIKRGYPNLHIVIFTRNDIEGVMELLIGLKISGVLSKDSSIKTIRSMVDCIRENHTMLPLSLFHQIQLNHSASLNKLNNEEILMMNMLIKGNTHEQIANQIHVSKRSVDNYLKRIYNKLNVKSRVEAIEKFIKSKYY